MSLNISNCDFIWILLNKLHTFPLAAYCLKTNLCTYFIFVTFLILIPNSELLS